MFTLTATVCNDLSHGMNLIVAWLMTGRHYDKTAEFTRLRYIPHVQIPTNKSEAHVGTSYHPHRLTWPVYLCL
jgi:hypothetical protein